VPGPQAAIATTDDETAGAARIWAGAASACATLPNAMAAAKQRGRNFAIGVSVECCVARFLRNKTSLNAE
jgi:hypothetical protein